MTKPANKKPLLIYSIIAGVIFIMVFFLYGGKINSNLEIRKEQRRLDSILSEINNLYIQNEDLKNQYELLEAEQQKIHGSAEANRQKIDELREEYDNSKLFLTAGQEK